MTYIVAFLAGGYIVLVWGLRKANRRIAYLEWLLNVMD